jgi:hypothetical protein
MAKRTKKPPKKREPPWLAAARDKLRRPPKPATAPAPEGASPDEFEAVADALIEMAGPDLDALGDAITEADAHRLIGEASMAYNAPLFDEIPAAADGESPSAKVERLLGLAFEAIPGLRERHARMLDVRRSRFGHLRRPIMSCKVTFVDRDDIAIALELLSADQSAHMQAAPRAAARPG